MPEKEPQAKPEKAKTHYGYATVDWPYWLAFSDELSPRAKILAMVLFSRSSRKGNYPMVRQARRGLATMRRPLAWYAKLLACSKRTAQRTLAELEAYGLIARSRQVLVQEGGGITGITLTLRLYLGRWNSLTFRRKPKKRKEAKVVEEKKPLLLQLLSEAPAPEAEPPPKPVLTDVNTAPSEKVFDVSDPLPLGELLNAGDEVDIAPPWDDDGLWEAVTQDEREADLEWEREKLRVMEEKLAERLKSE